MIRKKQQTLLIQKLIIQYRFFAVHSCYSHRTGCNCFSKLLFSFSDLAIVQVHTGVECISRPTMLRCFKLFCCLRKQNKLFVHSRMGYFGERNLCCHLVQAKTVKLKSRLISVDWTIWARNQLHNNSKIIKKAPYRAIAKTF